VKREETIKLSLIENAKESLLHAVDHLIELDSNPTKNAKRVIIDIYHAFELFLKEKLSRIHPAFLWKDIDKFPSAKANTVNTIEAVNRLNNIGNISLPEAQIKTIEWCREIRNRIEHYSFEIGITESKVIIGRMLSLVFDFTNRYLDYNLENELKTDDTWDQLIDNYAFFIEYVKSLEKRLQDEKREVISCPICESVTYDIQKNECLLCEFSGEVATCDCCGNRFPSSDPEIFRTPDGKFECYDYRNSHCIDASDFQE